MRGHAFYGAISLLGFLLNNRIVASYDKFYTSKRPRCLNDTRNARSFDIAVDPSIPFPVYFINMAASEERRRRIETSFGRLWDLRRFEAVDGRNKTAVISIMGTEQYARVLPFLKNETGWSRINGTTVLSETELGCILSHLTLIRKLYFEGHDAIMIMEDDLSPHLL